MWFGDENASSTWEVASNLPFALVKDFEKGIHYNICHESFSSGGETYHTVSAKSVETEDESSSRKRRKVEIHTSSSG